MGCWRRGLSRRQVEASRMPQGGGGVEVKVEGSAINGFGFTKQPAASQVAGSNFTGAAYGI